MNIAGWLPEVFHWLRPWWLLGLLPAAALGWQLLRQPAGASGWASVIDKPLLDALLDGQPGKGSRWPVNMALLCWVLACIALAGPSMSKQEQLALKQADAVVILLDLSPSMVGTDITPTRLQAAHYKILDLLRQRREGYTALVAYAGSAHVVAPLSDDANTIAALVTTLEPGIMPRPGSRPEDAVGEALQLLDNAHFPRGRLLLLTDGVVSEAAESIHRQLQGSSVELHVIGIGTAEGAAIPLRNGGLARNEQGGVLINKLDETSLAALARENGGHYSTLRPDDSDIAPLLQPPVWLAALGNGDSRTASHTVEHWQDSGFWFALPCLLLVPLLFRRGLVLGLLLLPALVLTPTSVRADESQVASWQWPSTWKDWWQTPDQQAAEALQQGDAATAAKTFSNPQWKAFAEYQNGQHHEAAEHFALGNDAAANYNRGNALARAGDLQGALDAYDEALRQQPALSDANYNRDIVRKLLEQQKQQNPQQNQQQNQNQQDQQQDQQQQSQQQQDQQQQNGEQQQGDQQPSQQQAQQQDGGQDRQQDASQQQNSTGSKPGDRNTDQQQPSATDEQQQPDQQADDQKKTAEQKARENTSPEQQGSDADSQQRQHDNEQQQALQQWLRKVPDDPGGLLRNKFEYYYQLDRQGEHRQQRANARTEEEETRW